MAEKELSILVRARGAVQAAREIGKVNTAISTTSKLAHRGGAALGTLKGRMSGLVGAIGPLLGVGGLLGLTSLLTSSINEAATFGANVANVAKITNLSAQAASAMVDTLDKWGVSGDRLIPMLGKLEKNVGAIAALNPKAAKGIAAYNKAHEKDLTLHQRLARMYPKAIAFQKQYGVSLFNNKGKIADANTLLLRSADYFNSNASASDKATFMSKLWGKSWQDMIPILSKGSKFIKAQEADSIHLTDTQLANITKFRDAQRDFQDTFGDVQVKVGAELMPLLTSGLKAASGWFDANGDKIAGFFHDAADAAGDAADNAGRVFGALKTGWEQIPAPMRDFLLKGLIADRTIKFLFGVSPIKIATDTISKGIGGLLGGFTQRGSSPANPMYVAGVGASGVTGAAGAGGGLSGIAKVFLVGAAVGVAAELWNVRSQQSDANRAQGQALTAKTTDFVKVAGVPAMQKSLDGILALDRELSSSTDILNTRALAFQMNLDGVRDSVRAQEAKLREAIDAGTTAVETTKGSLKTSIDLGGSKTQRATDAASRAIVAAVNAIPAPIVNVSVSATTVNKTTTISQRTGTRSGSRDRDNGSGLGPGGA